MENIYVMSVWILFTTRDSMDWNMNDDSSILNTFSQPHYWTDYLVISPSRNITKINAFNYDLAYLNRYMLPADTFLIPKPTLGKLKTTLCKSRELLPTANGKSYLLLPDYNNSLCVYNTYRCYANCGYDNMFNTNMWKHRGKNGLLNGYCQHVYFHHECIHTIQFKHTIM